MTGEQRRAFELFREVVEPLRLRVEADDEGFPVVRGRHGRLEWYCDGVDCHRCPLPGRLALAVFTTKRALFGKILAVPGVRQHQRGDHELRAVFEPEALPGVAAVIRARRRRQETAPSVAQLAARERFAAARHALAGAAPAGQA